MAKGTVDAFVRYLAGEEIEQKILIPCEHYRYADSVNDDFDFAKVRGRGHCGEAGERSRLW